MLLSGGTEELFSVADERGVAALLQSSEYYKEMTRDEMEDFVSEGMILHPEKPDYLT